MKACGRAMGEAVWVKHPLPGCSSSPFLLLTCCICRQCFMLQCARWRIWCVKRGLKIFAVHYSCVMMSTFQKAVRCYLCLCRFCVLLSLIFFITDTELESLHLPATMSTLEFVFFFFLQCRNILWANIVKCEEALWCMCLGLQDCWQCRTVCIYHSYTICFYFLLDVLLFSFYWKTIVAGHDLSMCRK